jgi:O-antigen/teichoic acid export membrane protein
LLCDQGAFALTNFALNIMFARWLSPAEYGLFGVSFSGFILLTGLHWAAFLEPLLVLQVPTQQRRSYIAKLAWEHVVLIVIAAMIGGTCNMIAHDLGYPTAGAAILGALLAGSMVLTLLAARRACLVFLSTRVSAIAGLFYLIAVLITGCVLHAMNIVTWHSLWSIMGGWSLLCSMGIVGILYRATVPGEVYAFYDILKFQWRYAKWAGIAALHPWLRYEGIYLFLANFIGLEAVAQARALLSIGNPLGQINLAMNASWLVAFSDDHVNQRKQDFVRAALPYGALAVSFIIIAWLFSDPIMRYSFGVPYLSIAWLLPLLYLAISFNGMTLILETMQKSRCMLVAGYLPSLLSCIAAVSGGLFLIPAFGLVGGVMTVVAASTVAFIAAITLRIMYR